MVSKQTFGNQRGFDLRTFAELDDMSVRKLAVSAASEEVNSKKHKRISNAIIYSIPLAAGLAAAIKNPASRIGRLGSFAKTAAGWGAGFAVIDLALNAKHKLEKKMPKAQKFNREHPVLSFIGSMATAAVALFAGGKIASKVANSKVFAKYANNAMTKIKPFINKISARLDGSKLINKVADIVKTAPKSVKSIAKGIINNGIWILAGTSVAHSIGHERARNKECINTYIGLKNAQAQIRDKFAEMEEAQAEQV